VSEPALTAAERWIVRTVAFAVPLIYSPVTYDGYVLPKLLLARAAVLALLFVQLVRMASPRGLSLRRTPLDAAWLALLASAMLSTIVAVNVNVAIFGTYGRYDGLLTLVLYALLFYLCAHAIQSRAEARTVLRVLVAGGYVVAAIAIFQSVRDSLVTGSVAPAYGSLGNPNVLGGYLAMVIALAVGEVVEARSWAARVLGLNAVLVPALALVLTFSRSGWVAGAVGVCVVVLGGRLRARSPSGASRHLPMNGEDHSPSRSLVLAGVAVGAVLLVIGVVAVGAGPQVQQHVAARAFSLSDPGSSRVGIWKDSLRLVASRPLTGYGPDTVGLVFPRFQSGDWGLAAGHIRQPIDKAHAEALQVAATQGVLGLAAYVFMLVMFVRVFWRGRRGEFAVPVFAAWVAYEVELQVNFTALGSAFPFWILAAAAIVTWDGVIPWRTVKAPRPSAAVGGAALVAAFAAGVVVPFVADADLKQAYDDDVLGPRAQAAPLAATAAKLSPQESVYATEVANIAFERGHWEDARAGYREAIRLGSFNPLVYRNLALADQRLGLVAEARDAAREAVRFGPYDPSNQVFLAQFGP